MTNALMILLPIVMLGVVFVLGRGIFAFAKGGEGAGRLSNRMMQWRIGLQFVAIVLIAVLSVLLTRG